MIIFSHRARGFKGDENSLCAIEAAAESGCSVEIDLRFVSGRIALSHNRLRRGVFSDEFAGLLKLAKKHPGVRFALHLKENSLSLFQKVGRGIGSLKNCLIFVTDFKQGRFIKSISNIIGRERIALYATGKKPDLELLDKVEYLWLDESREHIYDDLGYFHKFGKKVICCSPELFKQQYRKPDLERFKRVVRGNQIFGLCTDFPEQFNLR